MQTNPKLKIALIGAGNTATVLCKEFLKAGHCITTVWSRTSVHSEILAKACGAKVLSSLNQLQAGNDLVILAVPDDAIAETAEALPGYQSLLVHTAGSVSRNVLAPYSNSYGVLYPLQSLRKELPVYTSIPFLIDANTNQSFQLLQYLAGSISSRVVQANDQQRLQLHLSAVFVSNFSNHLCQLAAEWCQKKGLSFDMLIPLIQEVALRQNGAAPATWQTGPAARGDRETVERHLQILKDDPFMEQVYRLMSTDLLARNSKKDDLRTHKPDS